MRTEITVDVAAEPAYVWAVLTDVARWPTWTTAVRRVTLLDAGTLRPEGVLRVRAAGLPDRTWRVSDWAAGRSFTWTGGGVGVHARLSVRLARGDRPGVTRVRVEHERSGWLAGPVVRVTGGTQRRHLHALVEGLQRRCQQKRVPARA